MNVAGFLFGALAAWIVIVVTFIAVTEGIERRRHRRDNARFMARLERPHRTLTEMDAAPSEDWS